MVLFQDVGVPDLSQIGIHLLFVYSSIFFRIRLAGCGAVARSTPRRMKPRSFPGGLEWI